MTSNISKLYDKEYCEHINSKQWRFDLTPSIVAVLYNYFNPDSVIDVGCANGIHLAAFKDLGMKRLFGVEGTDHWSSYIEKYFGCDYVISDIRKPLLQFRVKFDLVISFEVLEHLEKRFVRQAVKNLISLGNTLCISASPYKRGFNHLNPQPRKYWIKIFESLGATYCEEDVGNLQDIYENLDCPKWFKYNLKVFKVN